MQEKENMYHLITKLIIIIIILIINVKNSYSQNHDNNYRENFKQKYVFINDYVCVEIYSNKIEMSRYDTCNIQLIVKNKSDSIITFFDEDPGYTYTVDDNYKTESNLDLEYGSGFSGIDTYAFLKKIYPNDSFYFNFKLSYNKFSSKLFQYNSFRINLHLGYLFESSYNLLDSYYPDLTSIKTEYVENNKIQTSTLILGMFIRSWIIKSFSVNILKDY